MAVRLVRELKGYANLGGCQMGSATPVTLFEEKETNPQETGGTTKSICTALWLIEKLAQQEHWQKGEQSSSPVSLLLISFLTVANVVLLPFVADAPSAQGITLSANTRIAMKKAKIFISGAKIAALTS